MVSDLKTKEKYMHTILKSLISYGAVSINDCLEMLNSNEFMHKSKLDCNAMSYILKTFLTDIATTGAGMHRTCEDGAIENFWYYLNFAGELCSDHDARCLNDDGTRFLCDEWQGEHCSIQDIADELALGGWTNGWSNADCEM